MLRDLGYLAFTYGVPQQPPASPGYDVAQVRDGRIALLYTLLNGFTDPGVAGLIGESGTHAAGCLKCQMTSAGPAVARAASGR